MSDSTAVTVRLVVIHNGIHGMVTAGPASMRSTSRERRDRIRAAWICTGWAWDSSHPMMPVAADEPAINDLAVVAAMLMVLDPDLPSPHPDALRVTGEVRLDGTVIDGVVAMPLLDRAVIVTRIDQLPALLVEAAGS